MPKLSPIKVIESPTLPVTAEQYARVLAVIPNEFTEGKATRIHVVMANRPGVLYLEFPSGFFSGVDTRYDFNRHLPQGVLSVGCRYRNERAA